MRNTVKILVIVALVITTIWFAPNGAPEKVSAYVGWAGATNSPYAGGASPQPMDIDMSRSSPFSFYPSQELDSGDNPCVAWVEYSMGISDIHFVRWDGTNWIIADGTVYNPATGNSNVSQNLLLSTYPSLTIDSSDNPHIAWTMMNPITNAADNHYAYWDGTNWVTINGAVYDPLTGNSNISNSPGASSLPALILDDNNNPHIAWAEYSPVNADIIYIHWNGTNWLCANGSIYNPFLLPPNPANVSIDMLFSTYPSLQLDSNGIPHIAWTELNPATNGAQMYYVRWGGVTWVTDDDSPYNPLLDNANISQQGVSTISLYPFLAIDSMDNPHITWTHSENGTRHILYIHWDGTGWIAADGSSYSPPAFANVDVSRNSYPYDDYWSSLVLDSNDNPHVAWYDYHFINGISDTMYAHWDGTNWMTAEGNIYNPTTKNANFSRNTGFSAFPDLELDSSETPHIVWFDSPDSIVFSALGFNPFDPFTSYLSMMQAIDANSWTAEIYFVKWTQTFNSTFTLTKGVDTDSDGVFDNDGQEIHQGTTLGYQINWSFDNLDNDILSEAYLYDTIPDGTTYLTGAVPTDDMSYSTDGGLNWIAGEPPTGSVAGTMLRWGPIPVGWAGATDSPYVGNASPQPMDIDMSRSSPFSFYPSQELDSGDNPCVAWVEYSMGISDIHFVRWDGTNWIIADGTVYNPATGNSNVSQNLLLSTYPSLTIDSSDNPHIAWTMMNPITNAADNHYAYWDGTNWVTINGAVYDPLTGNSNISNSPGASSLPALILDDNNNPHIAWAEYSPVNADIIYIHWNGTNWLCANGSIYNPFLLPPNPANVSIDMLFSTYPSLQLDSNGIPHIAWTELNPATNGAQMYYVRWGGVTWVTDDDSPYNPLLDNANISQQGVSTISLYPFLAIDSMDNPHITWTHSENGTRHILYIHWDGTGWIAADGSSYSPPAFANVDVSRNSYPYDDYWSSLVLDSNDNPHVAWYDYHFINGISDTMYAHWDGTNWMTAEGNIYNPTTKNANFSRNTGFSAFPDLELDSSETPHIVWFDSPDSIVFSALGFNPFDPFTSYLSMMQAIDANSWTAEIYFVKRAPTEKTVVFNVQVTDPFNCVNSPVTNTASFDHAYATIPQLSNTVTNAVAGCDVIPESDKPLLEITKTASSMTYFKDDIFTFKVTLRNTGNTEATNVILADIFPREMEFVTSRPKGSSGKSSWKMVIGTLAPRQGRSVEFKFRLSGDVYIGEKPIMITNTATVSCSELDSVSDSASIMVRRHVGANPISIFTDWSGIDTKTFIGNTSEEITLDFKVEGGSSPYSVFVSWGDGEVGKFFDVSSQETQTSTHTYSSSGDYEVEIKVVDQFGKTIFSRTILHIK